MSRKTVIRGIEYFIYDFPADKNGKRKRIYAKTEQELLDKYMAERNRRGCIIPTTVREALTDFRDTAFLSPSERGYCSNLIIVCFSGEYGNRNIFELTRDINNDFLCHLSELYSEEFVKKVCSLLDDALTGFFDYDFPDKFLTKDKKDIILSESELALMQSECLRRNPNGTYHYGISAIMLVVIMHTGIRVNDICSLKWSEVFDDYIEVKGQKIPVSDEVRGLLRECRENGISSYENETYVFLSRNGKPITRISLDKACERVAKRCCLPDKVSPHTLRYSYGALRLSKGEQANIGARSSLYRTDKGKELVDKKISDILNSLSEEEKQILYRRLKEEIE